MTSRQERLTNELLVLRCQEGDAPAFEALVARWQARLWRHARRLTGEESAAWDVLQEAWIGIARGLARLENPAAFPAWAYQIVSYKCHDAARRDRRRRLATESYAAQFPPDADTSQCDGSLRETLEALPGPDRAILSLRYEEQFDTAEIAGILGIPEGTVKSRLYAARQRLRRVWKEDG
jgi:RNA polymerase sigma-70 factor, ECF subfamily